MKRLQIQLFVGAITLPGLGIAAYFHQGYMALIRQADGAREQLRRADQEVPIAKTQPSPSQPAQTVAQVAATDGPGMVAQARQHAEQREAALLSQPELQLLFEETRQNVHRADFGPLFRALGLSDEEQDRLTQALADWDVTMRDVSAVMKQQRLRRNDPALQATRSQAQAALDAALQEVLGANANQVLRDYTRSLDARRYVAAFGGIVSRLGEPLTLDQAEQLTAAFGEAGGEPGVPPEALSDAQWHTVVERSRQILSAGQWQVLRSTTPPRSQGGRWQNALKRAIDRALEAEQAPRDGS